MDNHYSTRVPLHRCHWGQFSRTGPSDETGIRRRTDGDPRKSRGGTGTRRRTEWRETRRVSGKERRLLRGQDPGGLTGGPTPLPSRSRPLPPQE